MISLAWFSHSGVGYQALVMLVGWERNREESSLGALVGVLVGMCVGWVGIGLGGMYGESRQLRSNEVELRRPLIPSFSLS